MKAFRKFLPLFFLSAGTFLTGCGDDDDTGKVKPEVPVTKASTAELHFDSRFASEDFVLNKPYLTASNEQVEIGRFAYFISNVELVRADGSVFKEPNSYHLIQEEDQVKKESFRINNVPEGDYVKVRFFVGVDSARNATIDGAAGDLVPDNHMTWMWNTGFIFLSAKGIYINPDSATTRQVFEYNVGKNRSLRKVELTLPAATRIDTENNPKIRIHADAKTVFGGPNVIQVKTTHHIEGDPASSGAAVKVADNYATMFRIVQVQ